LIISYYIDTSVFGGYFDAEFEEVTKKLFDQMLNKGVMIIYSELTKNELMNAPVMVKDFVRSLPEKSLYYTEITDEVLDLADKYIQEKVVGRISRDDCIHIALATINKADVLVSWNFKHIVNLSRIRGYNSVNLKTGYPSIEIRSPLELIEYEENKK
jgi:predicted nucleic acid-binding protein